MEVMIGVDPHKGSHTATMLDRDERELARIKVRAGVRQVAELLGVGERLHGPDVGGGVRWRDGLSALPAARRCRRDGAGRAGDVGVTGTGARLWPVDQDRSQRCPLGCRGGVARPVVGGGATGRSRHGVPVVGQAAHRRGPLADQAVLSTARPGRRAGARRDRQGSGRQPGTITARRYRARRCGGTRAAPPGPRARRRDRTPRHRPTGLQGTDQRRGGSVGDDVDGDLRGRPDRRLHADRLQR